MPYIFSYHVYSIHFRNSLIMTYNIYSLYYKIAVKIKGWTFLLLIYYFARNFQFIDINFRRIAYVYLLREPYIVITNEGKSTENFWRVISKSIKSNTILFFPVHFHLPQ